MSVRTIGAPRLPTIAISGAIALLLSFPANAASVSKLVTFDASGITAFLNPPVPVDPVTGSFDITFDPTQNYTDAAGITSPSINIAVNYSWVFNYDSTTGNLTVGGDYGSAGAGCGPPVTNAGCVQISPPTNDFILDVSAFLMPAQSFSAFYYVQTTGFYGGTDNNVGGTRTLDVVDAPSQTPLPAALPLFATGLGGLRLLGWRRKRKKAGAVAA